MPPNPVSRRQLLKASLASSLAISLFDVSAHADFALDANGFRILTAEPGTLRLLPEPAATTTVWGYDGAVPGPCYATKRARTSKSASSTG